MNRARLLGEAVCSRSGRKLSTWDAFSVLESQPGERSDGEIARQLDSLLDS